MRKRIPVYILVIVFMMIFFVKGVENKWTDSAIWDDFHEHYRIYSLPLPDTLSFAGEPVPVKRMPVYERLDKEMLINVYWQSSGIMKIKRAHQFFPIIEPILKQNGIPADFKYLAVAESNLEHVRSRAGAAGIWQLMKQPAKDYGLIVDGQIDQRYDIQLATQAACRYLNEAKQRFGSWTMAAAAYNRGMQGLDKAVTDQGETDYYRLFLNPETSRYLYRILATKIILENPTKYGFHVRPQDMYQWPEFRKVKVDTAVTSWPHFARQFQLSYGELRFYNPFIRDYAWDNKLGKTIYINIPLNLERRKIVTKTDTLQPKLRNPLSLQQLNH